MVFSKSKFSLLLTIIVIMGLQLLLLSNSGRAGFMQKSNNDSLAPALLLNNPLFHEQIKKAENGVEEIFRKIHASPKVKLGNCSKNILEFTKQIIKNIKGANSEILILFRFNPATMRDLLLEHESGMISGMVPDPLVKNLVVTGLREISAADYSFHVVLRNGGKIYDLSLATNYGIPQAEYFDNVFLNKAAITTIPKAGLSGPMIDRKLDKLRRYSFKSRRQMLSELRIRKISIADYINFYHKTITDLAGNCAGLWLEEENTRRSIALGEFLSEKVSDYSDLVLPDYNRWTQFAPVAEKGSIAPYATYSNGMEVYAHPENLLLGESGQIVNAVTVVAPFFEHNRQFNRTGRGVELLKERFFPKSMFDLTELKNKVVVDMAAGGGLAVEELREKGVSAFGVDIALSPRHKKMMLHDTSLSSEKPNKKIELTTDENMRRFYIQAHAASTGIADNQVDIIYETNGVFLDLFWSSSEGEKEYLLSVLKEWERILKPGGKIRISNIDICYEEDLRKFFNKIPGLRFVKFELVNPAKNPFQGVIELIKEESVAAGNSITCFVDDELSRQYCERSI